MSQDELTVIGLKIVSDDYNVLVLWTWFSEVSNKILDRVDTLKYMASLSAEIAVMIRVWNVDASWTGLFCNAQIGDMLKYTWVARDRDLLSAFKVEKHKKEGLLGGEWFGRLDVAEMVWWDKFVTDSTERLSAYVDPLLAFQTVGVQTLVALFQSLASRFVAE